MINYKKQVLAFILGFALANSSITVTGPYCTIKANEVPSQNKEKFLKICNYIDKYNKTLKETNINEDLKEAGVKNNYDISEQYFIDLIMQDNRYKVQEYLNNYTKNLNDLFSRECAGGICYHDVQDAKNELLTIFKALKTSVSDYFNATK